jgi:Uma2 family endonuclease
MGLTKRGKLPDQGSLLTPRCRDRVSRCPAMINEITSPSNAAHDRVMKMHYYAPAGIERYLIVEPKGPVLHLHRLHGDTYREEATAVPGQPLALSAPVEVSIDPRDLLPGGPVA